MNRPPEILINTGYVTDANGVLTEMVIPSNVKKMVMPQIVTCYAETLSWIPSTASAMVEFNAPGVKYVDGASFSSNNTFGGYTKLKTLHFPVLQQLTNSERSFAMSNTGLESVTMENIETIECNTNGTGQFMGCTSLTNVTMPKLKTLSSTDNSYGNFKGCTALASISFPSLASIVCGGAYSNGGIFMDCSSLETVNFPKIKTITASSYGYVFRNCVSLSNVTFGSIGNPVTSISSLTFATCTQPMTITIYTANGASLANEPWGATNADTDIIYEVA